MSHVSDAILFSPVWVQADLIRQRKLSPIDLTEGYLERIAQWNGSLDACARVTADSARAEAKRATAEIERGHYRGPLHGIPYGAKDLFATAGVATEWGAGCCRGQMFDRDATVVARLRDAG